MIEAGVVLDKAGMPTYWHTPEGSDGGSLPDSYKLWNFLWYNRDDVSGFAHSHPGDLRPVPSDTDITTFAAIEAGLGRRLDWWIITQHYVTLVQWWDADKRYRYWDIKTDAFPWVSRLRELSKFKGG